MLNELANIWTNFEAILHLKGKAKSFKLARKCNIFRNFFIWKEKFQLISWWPFTFQQIFFAVKSKMWKILSVFFSFQNPKRIKRGLDWFHFGFWFYFECFEHIFGNFCRIAKARWASKIKGVKGALVSQHEPKLFWVGLERVPDPAWR